MRGLIAAVAFLLMPGLLGAQEVKLPDGVVEISTDDLKGRMDRGEKLILINSLSPLEFTQSKITGSVNIPYGHLRDGDAKLPADTETVLVFYCLGPK